MSEPIKVLGISGSLRMGSYNTALLRAAGEVLPDGMTLEIFDLSPITLYNEDVRLQGYPEPVQNFRNRIAYADAILIASPEYNYSFSGVLKNALDWASRTMQDSPLRAKPAAIMGASGSGFGAIRGTMHLRQVCHGINMMLLGRPEVHVSRVQDKFDTNGRLIDETTRESLQNLMLALADWVRLLQKR